MSIIRENINEKFTEDSDPIHDMGIGLPVLKEKWRKENEKWAGTCSVVYNDKVKQFCDKSYDKYYVELTRVMWHTIDMIIDEYPKQSFQEIFEIVNKNELNHLKKIDKIKIRKKITEIIFKVYDITINPKLPKKKINEVFTDDSDPIDDLGIGIKHQIEKFVEKEEYSASRNEYVWACAKHGKVEFLRYLIQQGEDVSAFDDKPIRVACYLGHKEIVKILLDAGANPYKGDKSAYDLAVENQHTEIIELIENHTKNVLKKLKESVNEKFTEDSDPIHDMGIGTITWKNIKRGDIITSKNSVGIVSYVKYDLEDKNMLELTYIPFYTENSEVKYRIKQIYERSEKILLQYANIERKMLISSWKKQYNIIQRWEIAEILKESLNERFTADSDPKHDLGIGGKLVNFEEIRSSFGLPETASVARLRQWLDYLIQIHGKTITGVFLNKKNKRKRKIHASFKICFSRSMMNARKLILMDREDNEYEVIFENTYFVGY